MSACLNIVVLVVFLTIVQGAHIPQIVDCDHTFCVDPIVVQGVPCLVCPHGQTCRAPNGKVLTAGKVHDVQGLKCRCRPTRLPNWHIARCDTD